ncbi:glycosyltransferase family 4 protein [Candidatus Woesebacteria bacterium]|nr:glycosyltransferase family 4 protein [Candidatus Woesebacteria bacterium]
MKILIDARLYGLENAGLGRYVMNLTRELVKLDHTNQYIVLLRKKYFNQLNYPENFQKVEADYRHYSLEEQISLPRLIKKLEPDLVHFPHFNVPFTFSGKFVVTIHDMVMHWQRGREATTQPLPVYFAKRLGYKAIFKHAVEKSSKIIVPSKAVKSEVAQYYKVDQEKIGVVYEGVEKMPMKTKNDKSLIQKFGLNEKYFIYTGNAYPHKNLERAIEAIVRLNQHSRVDFAIVCSRSIFTKRLAKIIGKKRASGFVKLLGFVPDDELAVLYKHSVGFVYPSLYEGFGLPALEAISAGSVALVSDIPVFREIYEENALYFDPYRVEQILSAMVKILSMGQKEREKFINRGQRFIKRYSWSKMAKETVKIYKKVLSED